MHETICPWPDILLCTRTEVLVIGTVPSLLLYFQYSLGQLHSVFYYYYCISCSILETTKNLGSRNALTIQTDLTQGFTIVRLHSIYSHLYFEYFCEINQPTMVKHVLRILWYRPRFQRICPWTRKLIEKENFEFSFSRDG